MKGLHKKAVDVAKQEVMDAARCFVECRAFANNERLRMAASHLQEVSDRAAFVGNTCPYCDAPAGIMCYSCNCFKEE